MCPQRRKKLKHLTHKIIGAVLIVLAIIWVNTFAAQDAHIANFIGQFGYGGVFGVAAISGFNIFLPIPVISFFPFFIEVGLDPVFTVIAVTAGMTVGDLLGFLIGNQGRDLVSHKSHKILDQVEKLGDKHWLWPLLLLFFYAGFVPLPNELLVIPMAFLGFKLRGMIVAMLLGNCAFNTLAALGLMQLIR